MAKKENKTETCTIVKGAVLTDKCIEFLTSMQEENNGYLKDTREDINNVISLLIDGLDFLEPERKDEIMDGIRFLNMFGQDLKKLMKP